VDPAIATDEAADLGNARGQQATAISRGMVTLVRKYAGRGPTKARTTIGRDHVLVVLHDTLTQAERTLADNGHWDIVDRARAAIQDVMRPDAIKLVQATLRREVIGFLSANHRDPDLGAEVFVLGPSDGAETGVHEAEASE
jgi:uncharacterized protein YbcI